mmetsp:Transcript_28151/g.66879  ORF Transcript_28151/g.66879 Transcript_28151/m.66879 type:complete len:239 (+) Transcript_28151:396-1112(+)
MVPGLAEERHDLLRHVNRFGRRVILHVGLDQNAHGFCLRRDILMTSKDSSGLRNGLQHFGQVRGLALGLRQGDPAVAQCLVSLTGRLIARDSSLARLSCSEMLAFCHVILANLLPCRSAESVVTELLEDGQCLFVTAHRCILLFQETVDITKQQHRRCLGFSRPHLLEAAVSLEGKVQRLVQALFIAGIFGVNPCRHILHNSRTFCEKVLLGQRLCSLHLLKGSRSLTIQDVSHCSLA